MAGIAPWLTLPDDDTEEGKMRKELREMALKSYANAVDPQSPDYLLWRQEGQTLVDGAYVQKAFFVLTISCGNPWMKPLRSVI